MGFDSYNDFGTVRSLLFYIDSKGAIEYLRSKKTVQARKQSEAVGPAA